MPNIAEKIVLDLETKKGFDEIGQRNLGLLGVSVAGIYSYKDDVFKVFPEKEINQLKPYLQRAELVIGFNIRQFDYPVLQPYLDFDLSCLNTLDIFEEVQHNLGFRLSLNSIAKATLNTPKIGSGLDALMYFRQGRMNELSQYCQCDVFITRQLYEYGRAHGHLLYYRGQSLETIPVRWTEVETVDKILKEAFDRRLTVEIEYASASCKQQVRSIDIYEFDFSRIIAYCHLRKDLRTFNIRRILSAKLTKDRYEVPSNFNLAEFKQKQNYFYS